jgi:hypothetical protein
VSKAWILLKLMNSFQEFCLLRCDVVQSDTLHRLFGRTFCLHLQGRIISRTRKRQVFCCLGALFDPENGGSTFLGNIGKRLLHDTVSDVRRATEIGSYHGENLNLTYMPVIRLPNMCEVFEKLSATRSELLQTSPFLKTRLFIES